MALKDKIEVAIVVVVIAVALLVAYRYANAPCYEFKTDPLLRNGYAPARCL